MKDGQKVYIRGNSERGNEVIKTLKDLGGSNLYFYYGDDDTGYYYINPNGVIAYASTKESAAYPFLREFYKEIKLPRWKPKYKERYYRISWEGSVIAIHGLAHKMKKYAMNLVTVLKPMIRLKQQAIKSNKY